MTDHIEGFYDEKEKKSNENTTLFGIMITYLVSSSSALTANHYKTFALARFAIELPVYCRALPNFAVSNFMSCEIRDDVLNCSCKTLQLSSHGVPSNLRQTLCTN